MSDIMKFFGTLAEILLLAAVFNYVIKGVNKKYRKEIMASQFKDLFNLLMKFTVKNHKFFGIGAVVLGSIHGIYQLNATGFAFGRPFILAGSVTLNSMVLLSLFGIFGFWVKKAKRGIWFYAHRIIAAVAVVALGLHLVL